MSGAYDDIIRLPHPDPANHPRMPMSARAAQFAPFAALQGYGEAILETNRRTEPKRELDEAGKQALDAQLQLLQQREAEGPEIAVTYFIPDVRKDGGVYVRAAGRLRRIDPAAQLVILDSGESVGFEDILTLEAELSEPPEFD